MLVYDCHTHLDDKIEGSPIYAATEILKQIEDANIEKAIILHLESQRWSLEDFIKAISISKKLIGFANIHPDDVNAEKKLTYSIKELGFKGLKLHPRLQDFVTDSINNIKLVQFAGKLGIPVLIDAFPDGDWLMSGRTMVEYSNLCRRAPDTKVIVAHMGGHHVIDLMMMCKRIPNMYLDTSYSTLYYRGSSIQKDLTYAIRSLKFQKIFYGSDYPDRSILDTLSGTLEIFNDAGFSENEINMIMNINAEEFFGW
jgi:hypothetical protein